MTAVEHELRAALVEFIRTTAQRRSEQIATALNRVLQIEQQLGADAHPMLRHYLERRSYQKALDFLSTGHPETEAPQCGH